MKRRIIIFILSLVMITSSIPLLSIMDKEITNVWAETTIEGQWIKSGGRWWYKHTDGTYSKSAWEYINGYWYYFDSAGWMLTGWLNDNGKWYYLGDADDGKMKTGWKSISGTWYYFSPSKTTTYSLGQMVTGWLTENNQKYYLATNGSMVTGELIMNGKKYTFNSSGALTSEVSVGTLGNGEQIVSAAMNAINTKYAEGGSSLTTGCDNDGFLYCVLTSCGYTVPQTLSGQAAMGTAVAKDAVQAGDVIIYDGDVHYGAIYLGDNRVIYMTGSRFDVRITSMDYPGEAIAYRRIY